MKKHQKSQYLVGIEGSTPKISSDDEENEVILSHE